MGQLGEMFPGRKLRKETSESGTGEEYEDTGPLDLTSGMVSLRPRPQRQSQPQPDDDVNEQ
jgi:hypothetical protein